jgi:RNA polymerase sigma-70 factor, ECF subfamily
MTFDAGHDPISQRPRLIRLAYRILGSVSEAEDVVQDAYLRLAAQSAQPRSAAAWLTTVTTRLSIDRLRRTKARRETYPGPWLPEPLVTDAAEEYGGDLSMGFLLMLERLSPEERAAFTLREAFGAPYAEIAQMLDKTEPAIRQIVSRARERVRQGRPNRAAAAARHAELMQAFLTSVLAGDTAAIKSVLSADVVMLTDGGGRRSAALRPIIGREQVTQLVHFLGGRRAVVREAKMIVLNCAVAYWFADSQGDCATVHIEASEDGIAAIYTLRNPDKLRHLSGGA